MRGCKSVGQIMGLLERRLILGIIILPVFSLVLAGTVAVVTLRYGQIAAKGVSSMFLNPLLTALGTLRKTRGL